MKVTALVPSQISGAASPTAGLSCQMVMTLTVLTTPTRTDAMARE